MGLENALVDGIFGLCNLSGLLKPAHSNLLALPRLPS